jgi:hypothetical protein
MCTAKFSHQRPNFSVDLAEIICQELATLIVTLFPCCFNAMLIGCTNAESKAHDLPNFNAVPDLALVRQN